MTRKHWKYKNKEKGKQCETLCLKRPPAHFWNFILNWQIVIVYVYALFWRMYILWNEYIKLVSLSLPVTYHVWWWEHLKSILLAILKYTIYYYFFSFLFFFLVMGMELRTLCFLDNPLIIYSHHAVWQIQKSYFSCLIFKLFGQLPSPPHPPLITHVRGLSSYFMSTFLEIFKTTDEWKKGK
jgi:hypothetical protein